MIVINYYIDLNFSASQNSQESPCSPKSLCSPMKGLHISESMKELQRTYTPVNKRNGSMGNLLSQTDSLDGMHLISYDRGDRFVACKSHTALIVVVCGSRLIYKNQIFSFYSFI